MKQTLKRWRSGVAVVGLIAGLAVVPLPATAANDAFSPAKNVFGMTYGDWSAAWWQYILSIPTDTNPVLDPTGANCGVGQSSGPIFFLAGAATTDPVTRTCTVPAGTVLVFPIVNVECSTVEAPPFFGSNPQELRTCSAALIDGVDEATLEVRVDQKKVHKLGRFRVQSPVFDFVLPDTDNNFLGLPGGTTGSSVSDGYWVILKPLTPGEHVLHFEGAFVSGPAAGFSQDVTYHLTVTP